MIIHCTVERRHGFAGAERSTHEISPLGDQPSHCGCIRSMWLGLRKITTPADLAGKATDLRSQVLAAVLRCSDRCTQVLGPLTSDYDTRAIKHGIGLLQQMILDHQHSLLSIWIVAIAWSESCDRVPVAAKTKQPPKGSIIICIPQLEGVWVQMSQAADRRGNGQGVNGHGERVTLTCALC